MERVTLPASAVSAGPALTSVGLYFVVLAGTKWAGLPDPTSVLLLLAAAVVAPHLLPLARGWRRPPPETPRSRQERLHRVLVKTAGLAFTFGVIAAAYGLFPFYRNAQYTDLLALAWMFGPIVAVAAPIYIWVTDRRMESPRDGLYMAGLLVLGRTAEIDRAKLREHGLAWLVKAFFLPLMLSFAMADIRWWVGLDISADLGQRWGWYELAYRLMFLTDVLWAALGYVMTMRLLDSHIRTTEPTGLGWMVCIVCYPPFWPLFYDNYVPYDDGFTWGAWLQDWPVFALFWAISILLATAVYVWATIAFGIRFSNLTHRGIITNGPYRFIKHPAYVSKNLSWWLIAVPFVPTSDVIDAARMCLMLLVVNFIYYLRAVTEERHLSWDPVYRQYVAWIDQYGAVAVIRRNWRRLLAQARAWVPRSS